MASCSSLHGDFKDIAPPPPQAITQDEEAIIPQRIVDFVFDYTEIYDTVMEYE